MTVVLWQPDLPNRCACDGAYRPVLVNGKLIKSREPAWSMAEQTRDPRCLQERCRHLSKIYRCRYQHHKTSKGSGGGYPDCHFWADGRGSMYAELKRMGQNPTDVQAEVMASLQRADERNRVYLFRPCCMLVGAVDEALAEFLGTRCLYAGGSRGRPSLEQVLADMDATAVVRPTALARTVRERVLPGADPSPFAPACGLVVPPPADSISSAAMTVLEVWLRDAGFSPADMPYPLRMIVGDGALHVQCRVGLARPGHDVRVWRGGAPARPFPEHLLGALRADQVMGPSSDKVAWLIEKVPHSGAV